MIIFIKVELILTIPPLIAIKQHKRSEQQDDTAKQNGDNTVKLSIHHRYKGALVTTNETACPSNWRSYNFPFIDGKFDSSLYPIKEWRDANSRANATNEIYQWSELQGAQDDPMLLDEIRSKILPRRGIQVSREEILITVGSQQAFTCSNPLAISYMSGYGGIVVSLLPNDTIYYAFSDSEDYGQINTAKELHKIRPMCN